MASKRKPVARAKKLKPCPFCGSRALMKPEVFKGDAWRGIYCARVVVCGTKLEPLWPIGTAGIIAAWNRRKP